MLAIAENKVNHVIELAKHVDVDVSFCEDLPIRLANRTPYSDKIVDFLSTFPSVIRYLYSKASSDEEKRQLQERYKKRCAEFDVVVVDK